MFICESLFAGDVKDALSLNLYEIASDRHQEYIQGPTETREKKPKQKIQQNKQTKNATIQCTNKKAETSKERNKRKIIYSSSDRIYKYTYC